MQTVQISQRDMMRRLLDKFGHEEAAVCAAYADAERKGLVARRRNVSGYTAEGYAAAVWRDGHKRTAPWIVEYCRSHNIAL